MKNKTAMHELIERLMVMMDDLPSGSSRALGLATAADLATDLKQIERKQIIDAHTSGMSAQVKWTYAHKKLHPPLTKMDGEDYYNQTYNNE